MKTLSLTLIIFFSTFTANAESIDVMFFALKPTLIHDVVFEAKQNQVCYRFYSPNNNETCYNRIFQQDSWWEPIANFEADHEKGATEYDKYAYETISYRYFALGDTAQFTSLADSYYYISIPASFRVRIIRKGTLFDDGTLTLMGHVMIPLNEANETLNNKITYSSKTLAMDSQLEIANSGFYHANSGFLLTDRIRTKVQFLLTMADTGTTQVNNGYALFQKMNNEIERHVYKFLAHIKSTPEYQKMIQDILLKNKIDDKLKDSGLLY